MKDVNNLIRNKRIEKCYTQDDVAKKLNVTRQTVSNWEKDGYNINKDDLKRIFDLLEINVKNKNKIYKLILYIIILITFIFLIILFILNLKKENIKIYSGSILNVVSNTIFIETNNNYYLYLGSFNNTDNIIKLYYKVGNKNYIIYKGISNSNLSFIEEKGYEEYFNKDFDINKLYLDIECNDKLNTYKFNFKKEKTKFSIFKSKKIYGDKKEIDNINYDNKDILSKLLKKGFIKNNDFYELKEKEGTFYYGELLNWFLFDTKNGYIDYELNEKMIKITFKSNNDNKYNVTIFYLKDNKLICDKGDCNKYKNYAQFMVDSVNNFLN